MSSISPTYLAIHAGHSRLKLGLFQKDLSSRSPVCLRSSILSIEEAFPWSLLDEFSSPGASLRSIVTGSNLDYTSRLIASWDRRYPLPFQLEKKSDIPINILVESPEKVGADRLLNALAVNHLRAEKSSAIIVDTGTAITIDAVNQQGDFCGGAILPGVLMGAKALHRYTTTLPLISGEKYISSAPAAIGTNTESAMASGLYWGHLGAVKEIVDRIRLEFGGHPQLFLTGGATPILEPYFADAICDPNLSLSGSVLTALAIIEK